GEGGLDPRGGGRGRGGLHPWFPTAAARPPADVEPVLSYGPLPFYRPAGKRSGRRRGGRLARCRKQVAHGPKDLLYEYLLRILGARRVIDSHHSRWREG